MTITAIQTNGQKVYDTPLGILPAVNTILDVTTPPDEMERLEQWRQKEKKHEQIREDSLVRGTRLHELAAEFLAGNQNLEVDPAVDPWWRSLQQYLKQIHRTATFTHVQYGGNRQAIELPVYHPKLHYAGTIDWIGEVDPLVITLTDFKSSRWYKKPEYLTRHRLQAAAYRMAAEEMFGLEFDNSHIVVAVPKYRPQILSLFESEMQADNQSWLERLDQYYTEVAA